MGVCERKEERKRRLEEVSTSKMFAQDALAHGAERDCGRFRVLAGHLVVLFEVGSDGFGFDESKRRSQSRIKATMGRKKKGGTHDDTGEMHVERPRLGRVLLLHVVEFLPEV